MTDKELTAIKERLAAASPGPWRALTGERQRSHAHGNANAVFPMVLSNNEHVLAEMSPWLSDADRTFIIHSRTDVEALVAEVERLMSERDRVVNYLRAIADDPESLGLEARILNIVANKIKRGEHDR